MNEAVVSIIAKFPIDIWPTEYLFTDILEASAVFTTYARGEHYTVRTSRDGTWVAPRKLGHMLLAMSRCDQPDKGELTDE